MIKKGIKYIINPDYRFVINTKLGFNNKLSDEELLKRLYRVKMKEDLNLESPRTLNEKLQWLKLHDRKPIYTTMVDKYEAKKYVADLIGEEYIIPTLGVWEHFDDIDFNNLPEQFVLKCTHDSGGLVICQDKSKFNKKQAKKKIEKSLRRNYYYFGREWPYKNVKPRIIAEKYMKDDSVNELRDYKFYTFDGIPQFMMLNTGREKKQTTADYFDMNFNHLDFTWGYPNFNERIEKPKDFDKMKSLAEKLAIDTKHLRVDFYYVNDKIYFGELTFYDGSGFYKIEPKEYDYKLGEFLNIKE